MLSLIVPVYKNEANLDRLIRELVALAARAPVLLEVTFVVDGSPDNCEAILAERLPQVPLRSQLIVLSRNFGSFSAIRAGLEHAEGEYFAVLAADLQEPPELVLRFLEILRSGEADIVFGTRDDREDPWLTRLTSNLFWGLYRRFVLRDMPAGGVDVFGCTRVVRDRVVALHESGTNIIALLFWLGYRRTFVSYDRAARLEGKSAWTFAKKIRYSIDSVFNFTDLPIQLLSFIGMFGMLAAVAIALIILVARLRGAIVVPGYTPIVLTISFFGALTSFGLGVLGQYLWLALQNVRRRPNFLVASSTRIAGNDAGVDDPRTQRDCGRAVERSSKA